MGSTSMNLMMITNILNTPALLSLAGDLPAGLAIRIPVYGLKHRLQRPTLLPEVLGFLPVAYKLIQKLGYSNTPTETENCPLIFTPLSELDYTTKFFVDDATDRHFTDSKEPDNDEFFSSDHAIQYNTKEQMKVVFLDWRVKLVVLIILFSHSKVSWVLDSMGVVVDHTQNGPHVLPPGLITVFGSLTPFSLHLPDLTVLPPGGVDNWLDQLTSNQMRFQRTSQPNSYETILNLTQQQFHIMLILFAVNLLSDLPFTLGGIKLLIEGATDVCFSDVYTPKSLTQSHLLYLTQYHPQMVEYWKAATERLKSLIKYLTQAPQAQYLPPVYNHLLFTSLHTPCQIARASAFSSTPRHIVCLPSDVVVCLLVEQLQLTDLHHITNNDMKYYVIKGLSAGEMTQVLPKAVCIDIHYQGEFSVLVVCQQTDLWKYHILELIKVHPGHLPLALSTYMYTESYLTLTQYFEQSPMIEILNSLLLSITHHQNYMLQYYPYTTTQEHKLIAFTVLFSHCPLTISIKALHKLYLLMEKQPELLWILPPIPLKETDGPNRLWVSEDVPADMVLVGVQTEMHIQKFWYNCAHSVEPAHQYLELFWFLLLNLRPVIKKPIPINATVDGFHPHYANLSPVSVDINLNPDQLTPDDFYKICLFTAFSSFHLHKLQPPQWKILWQLKNNQLLPRMCNPNHNLTHMLLPASVHCGDAASHILKSLLGLRVGKKYTPDPARQHRLHAFKQARTCMSIIPTPRMGKKREVPPPPSNLDLHLDVSDSDDD